MYFFEKCLQFSQEIPSSAQLTLIFVILHFVFASFMFHDKYQSCKYEKHSIASAKGG